MAHLQFNDREPRFTRRKLTPLRESVSPSPVRNRQSDWFALSEDEKIDVSAFLYGYVEIENVSVRGREFVRRHHGEKP